MLLSDQPCPPAGHSTNTPSCSLMLTAAPWHTVGWPVEIQQNPSNRTIFFKVFGNFFSVRIGNFRSAETLGGGGSTSPDVTIPLLKVYKPTLTISEYCTTTLSIETAGIIPSHDLPTIHLSYIWNGQEEIAGHRPLKGLIHYITFIVNTLLYNILWLTNIIRSDKYKHSNALPDV